MKRVRPKPKSATKMPTGDENLGVFEKIVLGIVVPDCKMKLRAEKDQHLPPPRYALKSDFLTLGLHYGGTFDIGPSYSAYLGGESVVLDYVDLGVVGLEDFNSVAENGGVKKPMRFYVRKGGCFVLLRSDMDLYRIWEERLGCFREIHIYVDGMRGADGGSVGLDKCDGVIGGGEKETECGVVDDEEVNENDCEVEKQNGCETFNCNILEAREEPILSMLEWIMNYLMKRMQENRDRASKKWNFVLCPKIKEIMDRQTDNLVECIPLKSDDYNFQIECGYGEQYKVDMRAHTCGCRKWQLSGIPCLHALSVVNLQGWAVEDFTHSCYKVETYKRVYEPAIMPMNDRKEWAPTGFIPPVPPNIGRSAGRPSRARRREPDAPQGRKRPRGKPRLVTNEQTISRQQVTCKCSFCHVEGHNKKGCPLLKATNPSSSQNVNTTNTVDGQVRGDDRGEPAPAIGISTQDTSKVKYTRPTLRNVKHTNAPQKANLQQFKQPPTVFQQFQQRGPTTCVTVRGPTPVVGGHFIPSQESCISQDETRMREIFQEAGQKYTSLSSLVGSMNALKKNDKKGNAPK